MAFREVTGIQLDQPGQTAQRRKTLFREVDPTQIQFDEGVDTALLTQAQPQESLGIRDVASQAISNIPASGAEFVKNIVGAATSPIETTQAVTGLVGGAGAALSNKILDILGVPDIPKEAIEADPILRKAAKKEQIFDATVEGLSERYGGVENLKQTIATDPVGFLADVSAITTAGGALAAKLGKAKKIGQLQRIGEKVSGVGQAIEPLSLPNTVRKGFSKAVAKLTPESMLNKMVESSFKFSAKVPLEQRTKLAQTALNEGIVPSAKGSRKIQGIIDNINDDITKAIDLGSKKGTTILSTDVLTRLDDLKAFYAESVGGGIAIKEIEDMAAGFAKDFGKRIPIARAQQIKRNTNAIIRKQFGEMKSVAVETQKNIARGLKEEIANRFPEIQALNERESSLIGLNKELEKAVRRIDNRNIVSLGAKAAGAGGAAAGGAGGGLFTLLADQIFGNPAIKTKLAIAIKAAEKQQITKPSLFRTLRQAATQAGRIPTEEAPVERSPREQALSELSGGQEISEPSRPTFQPRLSQGLRKINGTQFGR
jgi:hypothetical protein